MLGHLDLLLSLLRLDSGLLDLLLLNLNLRIDDRRFFLFGRRESSRLANIVSVKRDIHLVER